MSKGLVTRLYFGQVGRRLEGKQLWKMLSLDYARLARRNYPEIVFVSKVVKHLDLIRVAGNFAGLILNQIFIWRSSSVG
ncbi:MAG: hypothetical protein CM1200mP10_21790 [Candidatus Neomarinimicrobiota bacterium]|nr:MAG: hypothetical protein CM1200mP10_21790 [Candidatus Neomarinimicrobiota bacterium]